MDLTLKSLYLLRSDLTFLNHGSFGACPQPVFAEYQRWQLELERQPIEFLGRRFRDLMRAARQTLAEFLGTQASNLVFVPNATVGCNIVARSLPLRPGDEVLSTNHEYGAIERTWRFLCQKVGASFVTHTLPQPLETRAQFVESLWSGVTERTRVILMSHVTSPTALIFPIEEICRRAREAGIHTLIDGAHAPGHIAVDLDGCGADFYAGNCHKWLSAPKGAGFLYARPEVQPLLEPLIVSWGWQPDSPGDSPFIDQHEWTGTRDIAAYLAVPAAIAFQRQHDWDRVRARCHELAAEFRRRVLEFSTRLALCPNSAEWYGQMAAVPLPDCDVNVVKNRLYEEFAIEIPLLTWQGLPIIRASFQAYNDAADVDRVVQALGVILGQSEDIPRR